MTDLELNEAVARKLGWTYSEKDKHWHQPVGDAGGNCWDFPDFANNIEAAWEIVDYCQNKLVLYQIDLSWSRTGETWYCTMGTKNQLNEGVGADTAPRAICLAFLKLEET